MRNTIELKTSELFRFLHSVPFGRKGERECSGQGDNLMTID